ncbi:CFEM domain-containing protein [Apiospora marii]|uniref:CFEM domain-containing protein n=1 Tax=Apiospora marii TaxID=335849 RepID=UPI00312FA127
MVWAGITVVVLFCVAFVITYLITATPGKGGFLDPGYRAQMSKIPNTLITVAAYVSVLTDIYTMIIPMHQIPKLGLSYKRKWGISFIFLTGAVVCENNLGLVCVSMPVVLALFVGRLTAFGQSLGSWVNLRKAQRHGAGDSASNLSPSDGNESAPESAPELPEGRNLDPRLGGMRKFIRNLNRSRVDNNTTVASTFNDLTSADLSYHVQLKNLHPSHSVKSEKLG